MDSDNHIWLVEQIQRINGINADYVRRIIALELAVYSLAKVASDKDGLIAELARTKALIQSSDSKNEWIAPVLKALDDVAQMAEIGKSLKGGE